MAGSAAEPSREKNGQPLPLYVMIEDFRHEFLEKERRRRRMPGRAPLAKAVIVREALQVYQEVVECGVVDDEPDPETVRRLIEIARRCQKPISPGRIKFEHPKEVECR